MDTHMCNKNVWANACQLKTVFEGASGEQGWTVRLDLSVMIYFL